MKKPFTRQMYNKLIMTFLVLLNISILVVLTFTLFEKNPVQYDRNVFLLNEKEYSPGDTITFDFKRCAKRDIFYTVTQNVVNLDTRKTYYLPSIEVRADKGCYMAESVAKVLPGDLPAGRYEIRFSITTDGYFKTFHIFNRTEVFNIK